MKETLYVIATKGKSNKEIYLKCSEKETKTGKILMEWTENIDEAYGTFIYTDVDEFANKYFKNFDKWYITSYVAYYR